MSIETYERQLALVEVYKKLAEAEKQIAEGLPLGFLVLFWMGDLFLLSKKTNEET